MSATCDLMQTYHQYPGQAGQQQLLGAAGLGAASAGLQGSLSLTGNSTIPSRPELFDPLANVDIDKLNAAYLARHQGPLTGSHMHL